MLSDIQLNMHTATYQAKVFSDDSGDFRKVSNANVLIYFPHGFGDWVQLSYVLPLLEPSNRYWITRFGDDNVALMENDAQVNPIYLGVNSAHCDDGKAFGCQHFGLDYERVNGSVQELHLPLPLHDACRRNEIDTVLWSSYPETWGYQQFPYHSKPRNLIPNLVREELLEKIDLGLPLKSSIRFEVSPWVHRWVESKLMNFVGLRGHRLCVIGRSGYSAVDKNWGHLWREDLPLDRRREGEECRDFMRLMLRKDKRWTFLVVEDRLYDGDDTVRSPDLHACSYAELFGTPETSCLPFGLVMKVVLNLAELCVGVPAGPYELSMAKPQLPTVGIWIQHLPSWYDEPKAASLHVIGRNVRECGRDERPGSFSRSNGIDFRTMWVDTRIITGEQVMTAVEQLI
jgi:hypothetical protein